MRKIILLLMLAFSLNKANAQPPLGSDMYLKNSAGVKGQVYRRNNDLGTSDSIAQAILTAINAKVTAGIGLDALDSTNLAKIALLYAQQNQTLGSTGGIMVMGSTSSAGANYTDGKVNPLVVDNRGNLKVTSVSTGAVVKAVQPTYAPGDTASLNVTTKGQLMTIDSTQNWFLEDIANRVSNLEGQGYDINANQTGQIAAGNITAINSTPRTEGTTASFVKSRSILQAYGSALGTGTALISVEGTYTGALSLQITGSEATDTWYTVNPSGIASVFRNVETGVFTNTIPSGATGVWEISVAGALGVRITALGAVTGTATVYIICGKASNVSAPYIKNISDKLSDSIRVFATNGFGGGGSSGGTIVVKDTSGTNTSMTVTNLNSLASSATAGWQSDRVSNVSTKALDYKVFVKLTMANTAPANDKAAWVFICPFYTTDAGTTWYAASQGTTTLPTGTQGTTTIASPHNLRLLGVLSYTTQNMVLQDSWLLSNAFGDRMPDGFSIIIINFTGAAISASGNIVAYSPINVKQ